MTEKFNYKKWHSCERKTKHKSKKSAMNKLRSIKKSGFIVPGNAIAYKCNFCGAWHLGHNKKIKIK